MKQPNKPQQPVNPSNPNKWNPDAQPNKNPGWQQQKPNKPGMDKPHHKY